MCDIVRYLRYIWCLELDKYKVILKLAVVIIMCNNSSQLVLILLGDCTVKTIFSPIF
jgi:hypothetical protein